MTHPADSFYFEDWKTIARKDWDRLLLHLSNKDFDAAAFFLQQTVEKYLKAWLLERGWRLQRVHELDDLLETAQVIDADLVDFIDICEKISGYYLSQRYPMVVASELTYDELAHDLEEARKLIETLYPNENLP